MIERIEQTPIMHRVVKSNGLVFIGGTAADDESLDMAGQAAEVFAKVDRYLAAAGSDKSKLLSVTIFVSDLALKGPMNEAWKAWLSPEHMPARATIGVGDLGDGCLVELTAIAAC